MSLSTSQKKDVSDDELLQVITDFLAMGHVENIVAMFRSEPRYLEWTGQLLVDERFSVRLGVSVLMEELIRFCPDKAVRAIPGLIAQLRHPQPQIRGEAASVLAIIGTREALAPLPTLLNDTDPQVVEIIRDILAA